MVRFINGLYFRAHVDIGNVKDLSWLSIPDRVKFFQMTHLFRIRNRLAPNYLLPNFTAISTAHSHNTRGSGFNFVLSRELSLSQSSFAFTAIKHWKSLDNDIKCIEEFRVFKHKLKRFFISQYDWLLLLLLDGFFSRKCPETCFYIPILLWIFYTRTPLKKSRFLDFNGLSSGQKHLQLIVIFVCPPE